MSIWFRFIPTDYLWTFLAFLTLIALPGITESANRRFESPSARVDLVELYTSEGCSSCAPADRWLSRFAGSPELWKRHVPVAFHVDYWDYIGWKDRFAKPEFSDRQRSIARSDSAQVYTPAVFLNGREWRGLFEGKRLPNSAPQKDTGVLAALGKSERLFEVIFRPNSKAEEGYTLHATLLGFGFESRVHRGENRGRSLKHDFVALSYQKKEMNHSDSSFQTNIDLGNYSSGSATRYAVAFWVTKNGDLFPVQSTGGYLNPPVLPSPARQN